MTPYRLVSMHKPSKTPKLQKEEWVPKPTNYPILKKENKRVRTRMQAKKNEAKNRTQTKLNKQTIPESKLCRPSVPRILLTTLHSSHVNRLLHSLIDRLLHNLTIAIDADLVDVGVFVVHLWVEGDVIVRIGIVVLLSIVVRLTH